MITSDKKNLSMQQANAYNESSRMTGYQARRSALREQIAKHRAEVAADREAGRAKVRAEKKAKRAEYLAKAPERHRAYRIANKDKISSAGRERRKKFPEKNRANSAKRHAMKLSAIPAWYGELDEFVMSEAGSLAKSRHSATGVQWHVDHMIPLRAKVACGLHCAENIQVIPAFLNLSKRNKMIFSKPDDWLKAL